MLRMAYQHHRRWLFWVLAFGALLILAGAWVEHLDHRPLWRQNPWGILVWPGLFELAWGTWFLLLDDALVICASTGALRQLPLAGERVTREGRLWTIRCCDEGGRARQQTMPLPETFGAELLARINHTGPGTVHPVFMGRVSMSGISAVASWSALGAVLLGIAISQPLLWLPWVSMPVWWDTPRVLLTGEEVVILRRGKVVQRLPLTALTNWSWNRKQTAVKGMVAERPNMHVHFTVLQREQREWLCCLLNERQQPSS